MMDLVVGFDFDGTIGNSYDLYSRCYEFIFKKYHSSLTLKDLPSFYGYTELGMITKMLGANVAKSAYADYLKEYKRLHHEFFPSLEKGIKELLILLSQNHKVNLVMVTGRGKETVDFSLKAFGVYDLFKRFYLGSDENKDTKALGFKQCLKDFSISPSQMLYIGDAYMDIVSSHQAGIREISVTYENKDDIYNIIKAKPDYLARTVEELKALLIRLCGEKQ